MKWFEDHGSGSYNFRYFIARAKGWQFHLSIPINMHNGRRISLNIHPRNDSLDIRYNSLWEFPDGFESEEKAKEFCENWIPQKHYMHCLGNDVCTITPIEQ